MKLDNDTWRWAVFLFAILVAGGLGVLALTPESARPDLLGKAFGPLGGLIGAVGALIAARAASKAHAETNAQTPVLEQIERQTNGNLTLRLEEQSAGIVNQVSKLIDERLSLLDRPGGY